MLFNSFDFAVFLPIVFLLNWLIFNKTVTRRNVFLLTASYVFYGFWDWRFLPLIAISSATDFFLGRQLAKTDDKRKRKLYLIISLVVNLGILGFFKYYNFFVESFINAFSLFGKQFSYSPLNIILPVGISFYTFQSLSYIIDIYYRKLEPTGRIINFCVFVSFFPQLVAGPIERARNLLPQFDTLRKFDYDATRSGLLLITFGLFKKIVVGGYFENYLPRTNDTTINNLYCNLDFSGLAIKEINMLPKKEYNTIHIKVEKQYKKDLRGKKLQLVVDALIDGQHNVGIIEAETTHQYDPLKHYLFVTNLRKDVNIVGVRNAVIMQ